MIAERFTMVRGDDQVGPIKKSLSLQPVEHTT
jgi:hypothetical protein